MIPSHRIHNVAPAPLLSTVIDDSLPKSGSAEIDNAPEGITTDFLHNATVITLQCV